MLNCRYIILFVFIQLFIVGCSPDPGDFSSSKPNIIVFLADDLGYGDLGCYGNPIIKTPALDKFATEGVLLRNCHSAGTVCSPSRAGLLTGRNPYRSGFYSIQGGASGIHLKNEEITIAELLKTEGYETGFFGKWHLSMLSKDKKDEPGPGEQGFDYWFATTHNAFNGVENCRDFIKNGSVVDSVNGWYCDVIVEEALRWLREKRDKDKPFFLMICSHEPHTPLDPPARFSNMYDNSEVEMLEKSIKYGSVDRPDKDITSNKKDYYGTVSQLDSAFSNLLKAIKEDKLEDNTIIIFTSDNGPEHPVNLEESKGEWDDPIREKCFGTPGVLRGMKRYPYEGGHRVPGIVRWPGKIPAATVSDQVFNGTDIMPTLSALAGFKIPSDRTIDGVNAMPALLGQEVERENQCLWLFPTHEDTYFRMPHMAMRHGDFTLLGWFPEKKEGQNLMRWMKESVPEKFALYNTSIDPGQENDISSLETEKLKELIPEMIELWIDIRDEGPDWNQKK